MILWAAIRASRARGLRRRWPRGCARRARGGERRRRAHAGCRVLAHTHGFQAGVVISASHNPWRDNGIKLFGADGFKLADAVELAMEEEILHHAAQIAAPDAATLAGGRGQRGAAGRLHSVPDRLRAGACRWRGCGLWPTARMARRRRLRRSCFGGSGRRGDAAEHCAGWAQHQ